MRRVTFSRNFTVSLSRTCQCYCKYCAFATHQAHLYAPAEVEKMVLDDPEIARRLEGLTIRKVIVVKDRIVNIVAA